MHTRETLGRVKAIDPESYSIEVVFNSGLPDRTREVLVAEGAVYENFLKNPVVLWAHEDRELPVGKVTDIHVEPDVGLVGTIEFAVRIYDFARVVWEMYADGFLNAVSVRFDPINWQVYREGQDEYDSKGVEVEFTEWELLEVSPVPIPCDPRALVKAYQGGKAGAIATGPLQKEADLLLKAVVPYRKYPLADEGMAWRFAAADGNALLDEGGWALYKAAHTWQVPDADPETRQAFKLPHHKDVDGELRTVWRGVAAAMARVLNQGAGPAIPEAGLRSCYNHLAKHYEEFDKPVPELKQYGPIGAVFAALGVLGAEKKVRDLELYVEQELSCRVMADTAQWLWDTGLDPDGDGLRSIMEGRFEEFRDGSEEPPDETTYLLGPEGDRRLVELLSSVRTLFPGGGKDPNETE